MPLPITKPRVTWCAFTRKWIVSPLGYRHECKRSSYKSDIAFRRWHDAMTEANWIAEHRIRAAVARDVWYGR